MAKEIAETAWKNYSDFADSANSGNPAFNQVRKAVRIINKEDKGSLENAIKILKKVDHPIAISVLKGIAQYKANE